MENEEQSVDQLDVGTESASSEPAQESAPQTQAGDQTLAPTESKETPFHEHPRWKELLDERNQERQERQQLEQRYKALEDRMSKFPSTPSPVQERAIMTKLKGIDAEFGNEFESVYNKANKVDQLEQELQTLRFEQQRNTAVGRVQQMHGEHKLSPELQALYNDQLEAAFTRSPSEFMRNVDGQYKTIHERVSKTLETLRRADRAAYVSDKKSDARSPSPQAKGKAPAPKGNEFSDDPEVARQQFVKSVVGKIRSQKSLGS